MGAVYRPEDMRKKEGRRLPPGLRDLTPGVGEFVRDIIEHYDDDPSVSKVVREVIESHYDEFKNLKREEIIEKLRKYGVNL